MGASTRRIRWATPMAIPGETPSPCRTTVLLGSPGFMQPLRTCRRRVLQCCSRASRASSPSARTTIRLSFGQARVRMSRRLLASTWFSVPLQEHARPVALQHPDDHGRRAGVKTEFILDRGGFFEQSSHHHNGKKRHRPVKDRQGESPFLTARKLARTTRRPPICPGRPG